ncbi:hypothetical protein [Enterobacter sp. JMULE2]|uniref:hypothetical protein n=1 Tax=Enterobacter sp. JMULE2 TaxID=2518340 RepID=UPI002670181A|nr:hypothetical protein [Enterobacter sp. JMULE2]
MPRTRPVTRPYWRKTARWRDPWYHRYASHWRTPDTITVFPEAVTADRIQAAIRQAAPDS